MLPDHIPHSTSVHSTARNRQASADLTNLHAVQPIPAHSQRFEPTTRMYMSSDPNLASRSAHLSPFAMPRTYQIHREEDDQVHKTSSTAFDNSLDHHQRITRHTASTKTHHYHTTVQQHVHSNTRDISNDMHHIPAVTESNHDLNARYQRFLNSPRRTHIPRHRQLPSFVEEQPSHNRLETNRGDHDRTHHDQEQDTRISSRRPSDLETSRFERDQDDDAALHHHRVTHTDTRFAQEEDDEKQLHQETAPMDLVIAVQPQELVRTGEGIHNEDSIPHVEVPHEVLDNDVEDPSDDNIHHANPHRHTLYPGNSHVDDDEDDQLAPHHPFTPLVAHGDDHHSDAEGRHVGARQAVSSHAMPQTAHGDSGVDLHVPALTGVEHEDYDADRTHAQHSHLSEQEQPMNSQHFENVVDSEKTPRNQYHSIVHDAKHKLPQIQVRRIDDDNLHVSNQASESTAFHANRSSHEFSANRTEYGARDEQSIETDNRNSLPLLARSVHHIRPLAIPSFNEKSSDEPHLESDRQSSRVLKSDLEVDSCNGLQADGRDPLRYTEFREHVAQVDEDDIHEAARIRVSKSVAVSVGNHVGYVNQESSDCRSLSHAMNREEQPHVGEEKVVPHRLVVSRSNGASSDSSKEIIPLLNPSNSFRLTRIKATHQGREKIACNSLFETENEVGITARSNEHMEDERKEGGRKRKTMENKEFGDVGSSQRVEAVARVADLLNPDCLDDEERV